MTTNNEFTEFCKTATISLIKNIIQIYGKVMILKLFVDSNDNELKDKYITTAITHNEKILNNSESIDAGYDLYTPENMDFFTKVNKLDLNVICSAKIYSDTGKVYNTGYYMYPRSSISKTPLRLANSTGIIDAGYRGHLIGMFDVVNLEMGDKYSGLKFDRYLQICSPGLTPIFVEIVDSISELGEETERGSGGFGSTGR